MMALMQYSKLETFHSEILQKSNHILRKCKNDDTGNLISTFWNSEFSTVLTKNKFPCMVLIKSPNLTEIKLDFFLATN